MVVPRHLPTPVRFCFSVLMYTKCGFSLKNYAKTPLGVCFRSKAVPHCLLAFGLVSGLGVGTTIGTTFI